MLLSGVSYQRFLLKNCPWKQNASKTRFSLLGDDENDDPNATRLSGGWVRDTAQIRRRHVEESEEEDQGVRGEPWVTPDVGPEGVHSLGRLTRSRQAIDALLEI